MINMFVSLSTTEALLIKSGHQSLLFQNAFAAYSGQSHQWYPLMFSNVYVPGLLMKPMYEAVMHDLFNPTTVYLEVRNPDLKT